MFILEAAKLQPHLYKTLTSKSQKFGQETLCQGPRDDYIVIMLRSERFNPPPPLDKVKSSFLCLIICHRLRGLRSK